MLKPNIGIDLGTTNSLISVFESGKARLIPNSQGEFLTPSAVYFDGENFQVGATAKANIVANPAQGAMNFKRKMGLAHKWTLGKRELDAIDLSAMVLSKLKSDAEADLGEPIKDVVISVPAYFNQVQRQATNDAAKIAGLNPIRLINEPTAAALAFGIENIGEESTFLVIDLGGGTFDVSLLNLYEGVIEVAASTGDAFLGGEDFTESLAGLITTQTKHEWSRLNVEQKRTILEHANDAKFKLSTSDEFTSTITIKDEPFDIKITRGEFELATAGLLRKILKPIERVLYDANVEASEIDTIILVGGATRMNMIKSSVARNLGKFPEYRIDPDHAVALGAAIQSALFQDDKAIKDVIMTDVSPFTVGLETARGQGLEHVAGLFSPMVDRNTPLPVSRTATYATLEDKQNHLSMRIYQGEAAFVADNLKLGEIKVTVPRKPAGEEVVEVRITYDTSGLIDVDATVLSTGKKHSLVISSNALSLDKTQIETRLKTMQSLKIVPHEQEENLEILARLNRLFALANKDDRNYIQSLIIAFKQELNNQDLTKIATLRGELEEKINAIDGHYVS